MASSSEGKKYFLRLTTEFGRELGDGSKPVKQTSTVEWDALDYDEVMTLQVLVFNPMIAELAGDSFELGVRKAQAEGTMDDQTAQTLLTALGKETSKAKR